MSKKFEYVPKEEYGPVIKRIHNCMEEVRSILKRSGVEFTWAFVGSTNRYNWAFITREVGGNKGFDHDVNIFLKRKTGNTLWDAKEIRENFRNAFDQVFPKYGYKNAQNKTTVLKVKYIDRNERTIKYSCDFAIFQEYKTNKGEIYRKVAKSNDTEKYVWELRGGKNANVDYKMSELEKYYRNKRCVGLFDRYSGDELYKVLSDEYLKLKNSNKDEKKCSFQLFNEAVCNVYNRLQMHLEEEREMNTKLLRHF